MRRGAGIGNSRPQTKSLFFTFVALTVSIIQFSQLVYPTWPLFSRWKPQQQHKVPDRNAQFYHYLCPGKPRSRLHLSLLKCRSDNYGLKVWRRHPKKGLDALAVSSSQQQSQQHDTPNNINYSTPSQHITTTTTNIINWNSIPPCHSEEKVLAYSISKAAWKPTLTRTPKSPLIS